MTFWFAFANAKIGHAAAAILSRLYALLPVPYQSPRTQAFLLSASPLELCGFLVVAYCAVALFNRAINAVVALAAFVLQPSPPRVTVSLEREEASDVLQGYKKFDYAMLYAEQAKKDPNDQRVHLFDPCTLDYFGSVPCTSQQQVGLIVARARAAQSEWGGSSFAKRRLLMRTMQRFMVENADTCARVSIRDSGKTMLDAMVGDVLTSCEKLAWLASSGEQYLVPEYRDVGRMMMMKRAWVEFRPVGVVGAIVPWNYPCHNLFNPISAALFSGNAIVIKVSEFASWSIGYYKRAIDASLDAGQRNQSNPHHQPYTLYHEALTYPLTSTY